MRVPRGARVWRSLAASWRSRPFMVLLMAWSTLYAALVVALWASDALVSGVYWWSLAAYWAGVVLLGALGGRLERRRSRWSS